MGGGVVVEFDLLVVDLVDLVDPGLGKGEVSVVLPVLLKWPGWSRPGYSCTSVPTPPQTTSTSCCRSPEPPYHHPSLGHGC